MAFSYKEEYRLYTEQLRTLEKAVGGLLSPYSFDMDHQPVIFTETRGHFHLQKMACSRLSVSDAVLSKFVEKYADLVRAISDVGHDWSKGGDGIPASQMEKDRIGMHREGLSPLGVIPFINYSGITVRDLIAREQHARELGQALKSGYSESDSWFKIDGCIEYLKNSGGK